MATARPGRGRARRPAPSAQRPAPSAQRLNWDTWFAFARVAAVRPAAGRLVFSFVDQAVQAAIRGQGVALVRSPFLQDGVASGDLVMPFPALRIPRDPGHRSALMAGSIPP